MLRVRFAPSPTGHLHIGGARTALFNWLYARHHQGKFILRIEDTDVKRSSEESTRAILDGLSWLGLDWDEGPYYQSQRLPLYREHVEKLINNNQAYPCYCTPQGLEERRQKMLAQKKDPIYDGTCRELSPEERKRYEDEGQSHAIRFKTLDGVTVMEDLIRGRREFDNSLIGDFIIVKSDGHPGYNFACVVDDIIMQISHVIRGDDHISNTPRQILLYEALGFNPPQFVHLPMIWGPDRTRLSKRHGATALDEYKKEGYLPEALINYLALLGWGTPDSQQIFRLEEMIDKFSLDRINKTPAIFDPKKLAWMNGQYIMKQSIDQLVARLSPYLGKYKAEIEIRGEDWLRQLVKLYQTRMRTLNEFVDTIDFFFEEEIRPDEGAKELLSKEGVARILEMAKGRLAAIDPFELEALEKEIRALAQELNLKAGQVIHPLRAAITGRNASPPIFDTIVLLGREVVLTRLDQNLNEIKRNNKV